MRRKRARPKASGAWRRYGALGALWLGLSALAAPARALEAKAAEVVATPKPFEAYYGVYAQGQKIGWMRHQLSVAGGEVHVVHEMTLQVFGMGSTRATRVHEARDYSLATQQLTKVRFSHLTGDAEVLVTATRTDASQMQVVVTAGGVASHGVSLPVAERLGDQLATQRLAARAKVQTQLHTQSFDPSRQSVVHITHTVEAIERRVVKGLPSQAIKITSKSLEVGLVETAWIDPQGRVLELQVGSAFTAKLEPPEAAKADILGHDLLVSQTVRAPEKIVSAGTLTSLTLHMRGFGELVPPQSPRQRVTRAGDAYVLALSRDPIPKRVPLGAPLPAQARGPEVEEALAATPFIQSTHPEIVAAARAAAGDAKDVFIALTRQLQWVHRNVVKEYRPEYSNALESLHSLRGDCTEHAILLVAMARAIGVPARMAVGVAYWPPGDGFGWHAWVEAYVDGQWTSMDPTWNQSIADVTHVKLAHGGLAEQAKIAGVIGALKIVSMHSQ